MKFNFRNPEQDTLPLNIGLCAERQLPMVRMAQLSMVPGAAIVAPSPRMLTVTSRPRLRQLARDGWEVWGIKESLRLLVEQKIRPTGLVQMDPGANQVARIPIVGGVTYRIASACAPALFDHLLAHGCRVEVYHSATGLHGALRAADGSETKITEIDLYRIGFRHAHTVIGGLTVLNRAVGLACMMGIRRIELFGATFGWREGWGYYAPGVTAARPADSHADMTIRLPGKGTWQTRADMLQAAFHVAADIRRGNVKVHSPSLALDLASMTDAFLQDVFPSSWPCHPDSWVIVPERTAA